MLSNYERLKYYINLKFIEKSNFIMHNPWEMFSKASKISSLIYKSKLVDSLKLYCDQSDKISIKNIFIISNDYIKEYQIEYLLDNLNNSKRFEALNKIFSYGRIHFMIPNFFYLRLYEVYEFKFKLNNIAKDYNFKCISEQKFNDLMYDYFNSSNLSSIDIIDQIIKITEIRVKKIKNKKITYELLKEINNLSHEYKDKVQIIRSFEKSHERKQIEEFIYNNKVLNPENEKLYYYYNKYYDKFNIHFKNSRKPIVGLFDDNLVGLFDVFSKYSLIYKSNYKLNFVNLKKLSHNSPLIVEIAVGIGTIASAIFGIYEGINRIKKGKLENIEKEIDIEEKKLNLLDKKIKFEKKFLTSQIHDYTNNLHSTYQIILKDYNLEIIDNKTLDDE